MVVILYLIVVLRLIVVLCLIVNGNIKVLCIFLLPAFKCYFADIYTNKNGYYRMKYQKYEIRNM